MGASNWSMDPTCLERHGAYITRILARTISLIANQVAPAETGKTKINWRGLLRERRTSRARPPTTFQSRNLYSRAASSSSSRQYSNETLQLWFYIIELHSNVIRQNVRTEDKMARASNLSRDRPGIDPRPRGPLHQPLTNELITPFICKSVVTGECCNTWLKML